VGNVPTPGNYGQQRLLAAGYIIAIAARFCCIGIACNIAKGDRLKHYHSKQLVF